MMNESNERTIIIKLAAALSASISLLERTPQARKSAASNKMFNIMISDYKLELDAARSYLSHVYATASEDAERKKRDGGE